MNFIRVANWDAMQHYKDRTPPWIRLYNVLLDEYEYSCLQDASKSHLIGIMMLASRTENKIPADPEWISNKISATEPVNLEELINSGFILSDQPLAGDSKALAECSTTSKLVVTKSRAEQSRAEQSRNKPLSSSHSTDVAEIFKHWVSVMGKNSQAKLTDKRRKCIEARLKEKYTVDQIKQAIEGCAKSPHHMGQNDSGTVYDDLTLICRTGDKLEQFANNMAKHSPTYLNAKGPETLEQFQNRAQQQASRARGMIDDLPD